MDASSGLVSCCQGRPVGLVMLSIEAVHSANAIDKLVVGLSQEQAWAKPFLRYREEQFYRYYSDPDALFRDLLRATCGDEVAKGIAFGAKVLQLIGSWPPGRLRRAFAKLPEKDLRRLATYTRRVIRLLLKKQFDSVASDTDDYNLDWPRLINEPSIQFLFQLFVPCFVHFGKTPQHLFAQATKADRPDLPSLRNLVKLDKRVAHHPVLRAVVHDQDRAVRRLRLDVVAGALKSYPRRLKRRAVKERVGGMLSKFSEGFGQRIARLRSSSYSTRCAGHSLAVANCVTPTFPQVATHFEDGSMPLGRQSRFRAWTNLNSKASGQRHVALLRLRA